MKTVLGPVLEGQVLGPGLGLEGPGLGLEPPVVGPGLESLLTSLVETENIYIIQV